MKKIFFTSLVLIVAGVLASAQPTKKVYVFNLKEMVAPGIARQMNRAMKDAEQQKAALFLIHMNTYGGLLDAADSMRTTLLNTNLASAVFIDNNAASAGALISIACNRIYMRSGASIGAATVVNETAEALPDKYQSYMRGMMRSTAEKRNRNAKIAEAMVDPRTYIEGVNDSGKVLTFTTDEAIANNYCNGKAENINDVLTSENLTGAQLVYYEPTWLDKTIGFFMNPAISGFLILVIIGGIYFEFQAPGTLFPIAASVIAAILYFTPLYLEGLAENWEILLVIIGVVLLGVEIFVIPGFGVTGITGLSLIAGGLILSLLNNIGFDFSFTPQGDILKAVISVSSGIILGLLMIFLLGAKLTESKRFQKMVLADSMQSSQGYVVNKTIIKEGDSGTTISPLKPSGNIIINGKVYPATALSGYIEKNTDVVIVEVGSNIVVKAV
ncbi:MAG: nodulation protein NfeD [Bacteroidetes bacterium]|nr:nodulation protein NfeD [Bacteroidota bacterium]